MTEVRSRKSIVLAAATTLALGVMAGCGGSDGHAATDSFKGILLTGQAQHVTLPDHKKYGIYVIDANNSGYSLRCTASDTQGGQIHMRGQTPAYISTGPGDLDLVYNTGSGDLTFTCSATDAETTTRPLIGVVH